MLVFNKIMKHVLVFICFLLVQHGYGQYTLVPDPNFEQALIDLGIDDDGLNGQFLTANAQGISTLNVSGKTIIDLTGIEAFVDLDQLFASNNNIETLDLSLLPETLWTLRLSNNALTEIDLTPIPNVVNLYLNDNNFIQINASNLSSMALLEVANQNIETLILNDCTNLQSLTVINTSIQTINLLDCVNLKWFRGFDSQLTSLDFSNNQEVEEVNCYNTPLTNIILPNNPLLEFLDVSNTSLTDLDISNCPELIILNFYDTAINQIDLSNNIALERLACVNSQLTTLDVSGNPNLKELWCRNNNITGELDFFNNPILEDVTFEKNFVEELDFSQNALLAYVDLALNPNLKFVNMKNGFNENLVFFIGIDCPQLNCVVVDDPTANNENIFVDSNTTLVGSVEDCDLAIDDVVLQELISIYPNPVANFVEIINSSVYDIVSVEFYDVLGKLVAVESEEFNHIDVTDFSSGVLFLRIVTDKGMLIRKIIKE